MKGQFWLITLITSLFLLFGCAQKEEAKPLIQSKYESLLTDGWLDIKLPVFNPVILSSKKWLDKLKLEPLELRSYGVKGKKKLVELFDAYLAIYEFLPPDGKKSLKKRLIDILEITQKPEYHNMADVDEQQFREDATSYLRLAYLMEHKGFDTRIYREEIKRILPRLNTHMPSRGVNQHMTFHQYYNYFGLEEPFPLDKAYEKGIIRRRWDPEVMGNKDVYDLTHEIFAVYQYGDKPEADFFLEEDKIYLREVLKNLIIRYIEERNPDLTAELLSCMRLLKFQDEPIFKAAVEYLLSSQNADGSFGDFERLRPIYEDYVKEGYYLHTTSVVLKALCLTFSKNP